jgi:hypothetical protein
VTNLALADFGIELSGRSVVLCRCRAMPRRGASWPPEHDHDSARVDLLTDLQQFLRLVANTPLRVTQGRTIYRAAQHRILDAFTFVEDALMDRERMFGLVYDLAFGLELVGVSEDQRLSLTKRGESWETEDLTEKVRAVYSRFLEERLPTAATSCASAAHRGGARGGAAALPAGPTCRSACASPRRRSGRVRDNYKTLRVRVQPAARTPGPAPRSRQYVLTRSTRSASSTSRSRRRGRRRA